MAISATKTGRAQYLRIQAIELIETDDKELLAVAEMLLTKQQTAFIRLLDEYEIESNPPENSVCE